MAHTMEIPCFYCSGDGATEVDIGGGATRTETCDDCGGTGISCRRAGDRDTGYPKVMDALERMRIARRVYLGTKRRGVVQMRFPEASLAETRAQYDATRAAAMRPAGGVV